MRRTLLIIPCFNEGQGIAKLLQEIQSYKIPHCDTLVIDDGSTDNTFLEAQKYSKCVKLITNLGIGGAVQTGIKYAFQNGYDFAIQIDGDGQHPPDQILRLLQAQQNTQADLVVGSRFIDHDTFRSSFTRRLGIGLISGSLKILYQQTITDPTSGLRLINRNGMKLFSKYYPVDFPEPVSLAHALENKFKVVEVPVQMRAREFGQSSISGLKNISYMLRVIGSMILVRLSHIL
jgi:glycosyltransferase involved in cell wall biosynthesis